jgi:hypothetical protein
VRLRLAGGILLAVIAFLPIAAAALLIVFVLVVRFTPPHRDAQEPAIRVQVSSSVDSPTMAPVWTPGPALTALPPTADPRVPPDPGTGPYPHCWVVGPILGQPCPPKPSGWTPPPH